jgi:hypothetical protein
VDGTSSLAFEGFEFVEGAGPIGTEEAGEAAVGEDFAAGLASWTVVGFVVCVADALDGCGAARAGLEIAAVRGHVGAEGGYFFGELELGFCIEAVYPGLERGTGGDVEAGELFGGKLTCLGERRELSGVEDLVRVGVADAGEDSWVGQGALEGAVFCGEGLLEGFEG